MRHSLLELYRFIGEAGLRDVPGFPLRAIMTAVAMSESHGDPDAWVAHDPPTNPAAPPSSGLFQVHRAAWPDHYDATQQVRISPALSQQQKIVRMAVIAKPIMADALQTAMTVGRILSARGFFTDPLETALLVDATWRRGADRVYEWARTTRTGNPRELVTPERAENIETALRTFVSDAARSGVEVAESAGAALGILLVLGLGAYALSQWKL